MNLEKNFAVDRARCGQDHEFCCEHRLVGDSLAMRELRAQIARASSGEMPVLILGERGTGKRRVAGMVHRASRHAKGPFVCVYCGQSDEACMESELFNAMERAHGGTLLLDEVSELPAHLQSKLCDALPQPDERIIATSCRDLAECVARGAFMRELYERLCGAVLHEPPLREHLDDLPALVYDWFEHCGRPSGISPEALRHLAAYAWPGNVRELENVLERAALLSESGCRMEAEAFEWLNARRGASHETAHPPTANAVPDEPLLTLEEMEKRQVLRALDITRQNRTRAAALLKISVRTLRNKLHQYRAEDPSLVPTLARTRN